MQEYTLYIQNNFQRVIDNIPLYKGQKDGSQVCPLFRGSIVEHYTYIRTTTRTNTQLCFEIQRVIILRNRQVNSKYTFLLSISGSATCSLATGFHTGETKMCSETILSAKLHK